MFFWLNEACRYNRIEIQNHLPPGTILQVHCRSKNPNGDVGVKQLKDAIVPIIMEFQDKSIDHKKRAWMCRLSYISKKYKLEYYYDIQVYRAATFRRCGELRRWIAYKDGIYFTKHHDKPPGFVLPWMVRDPNNPPK
ncbi:unnamed protein product [Arabidopsis lyrata]|uniref:Uncharacterized protein n=1 Tax=Arabidopsis lyrata subsp. lyrata TaxID=81972 RepID=D7M3W2_ARALL|nr:hypothetical protein ARALYDRAFT_910573 [Arabidopsis lyrata subsp. lyrata]CAH8272194.1 unnamed protein product [Arabidopsis lyrata]